MDRKALSDAVADRLGDKQLVYFGTRGEDVEAVADLGRLTGAFSIIAAYGGRSAVQSGALEDLTGVRPDLDTFDLDAEPRSEAMMILRRTMLRALSRPTIVFAYRPSTFVSAVCFARHDRCRYLGLSKDHQAAFEHKPWVESAIADLGMAHIPWRYISDDDQLETMRFFDDGPVMLRRSRTTGGVGMVRVDDPSQLESLWFHDDEAYVSVAPFLEGGIPVNVGGVVWHDGVTLHPASIQLIGIDGCTTRPFGFCGNDFQAVSDLGPDVLDAIDTSSRVVGQWLRTFGYRGAFGVDFLVRDGVPLFTEVNPRFQGSTHASCRLSVEEGESCLMLEHLAAHLGIDAPPCRSLREQAASASPLAHLVVHWGGGDAVISATDLVNAVGASIPGSRLDVLASPTRTSATGATVARISVRHQITSTGFELVGPLRQIVDDWNRTAAHVSPSAPGT